MQVGPRNIDRIGRQHGKPGLGKPLGRQRAPEIELVAAHRHHVDADPVEQLDHVCALINGTHQRRRHGIAAMSDKEVTGARPLGGDHRRQPGDAALPIVTLRPRQIVNVDDRQQQRFGASGARRKAQDCKAKGEPAPHGHMHF